MWGEEAGSSSDLDGKEACSVNTAAFWRKRMPSRTLTAGEKAVPGSKAAEHGQPLLLEVCHRDS